MGGVAVFAGTAYQQRVITFVYAHVLAQMRLGWIDLVDDTPVAVSAETLGPGDDMRIEFGDRHSPVEVQVKHGLTAGAKLTDAIVGLGARLEADQRSKVVLAVDRSSRKVHVEIAGDLERLRAGRNDPIHAETTRLLNEVGINASLLARIYIVPVEVDRAMHSETKEALRLLGDVLQDSSQANAALGVLVTDAGDLCARQLRRTRKDLVDLLAAANIVVSPPRKDAPAHRELDFSKQLIQKKHASAALVVLRNLETRLTPDADPHIRYRLGTQRASAFLQLGRYQDALAGAQRALDFDANGIHALVNASLAALLSDDVPLAQLFADRAVAQHPHDPMSWAAQARVDTKSGRASAPPGASIAGSEHYRTVLTEIAFHASDWRRVLPLSAGLLSDGKASSTILFFRATALASTFNDGSEDRKALLDAERHATDAIESIEDESDPLLPKVFVVRAWVRRVLGREDEANADLTRAQKLSSDDPDAIGQAAQLRIREGNLGAALAVLHHPVVDESPHLRILRARVLGELKQEAAAILDLLEALEQAPDSGDPDSVRLAATDVALLLGDVTLAKRTLASVADERRNDIRHLAVEGRLAFEEGRIDDGERLFRLAAAGSAEHRDGTLAELGYRLLRARQPAAACRAFEEAGVATLEPHFLQTYARSLMAMNDFVRAKVLMELLVNRGPLPDWAIALTADIALRQEDVVTAIQHLSTLVDRDDAPIDTRLTLAFHLADAGRSDEAYKHVQILLKLALSPLERSQVGHILNTLERQDEAIAETFRAFREAPEDPQLHRALIAVTMMSSASVPVVNEVSADTHVVLSDGSGSTLKYTIFGDAPRNPTRNEIGIEEAEHLGILGKRVGDSIARKQDAWSNRTFKIQSIVPAVLHYAQDAAFNYEDRFPGQPFFITTFHFGDGGSISSFAGIISSLESRKNHVAEVLEVCRKQVLPIGFAAVQLGVSIPDMMDHICTEAKQSEPLQAEWSDLEGQEESRSAASEATTLVLTRSGIKTAQDLGFLDQLASAFELLAPATLRDELELEIEEAQMHVEKGQKTMATVSDRLQVIELEAQHPILLSRLAKLQELEKWISSSARFEFRPLESLSDPGSKRNSARELIGRSSFDAVALTQTLNATMYADDLGLRRLIPKGAPGRTTSTIGLLPALAAKGFISASRRDGYMLALVRKNYSVVPPTRELLTYAVSQAEINHQELARVFLLLAGVAVTPSQAARLASRVMKAVVLAPVQVTPLATVVELTLEAMTTRWPVIPSCQAVVLAAAEQLTLMDQHLQSIQETCLTFAKMTIHSPLLELPPT
jgi:tetratricopeptide (TPR) repeat protein